MYKSGFMKDPGLWICKFWLKILCFMFMVDVKTQFLDKSLPEKGLILASNHFSNLDPPLLFWAYPYKFCAIAKKKLLELPFIGWLFRDLGVIKIDRLAFGPSTVKQAQEMIQVSNLLIFPEGTRGKDKIIREGKQGFGYLVHKTGAGVLPVYIDSADILPRKRFFPTPGAAKIIFGSPLTFEEISAKIETRNEKEIYREITGFVMDEIRKLKDICDNDQSSCSESEGG